MADPLGSLAELAKLPERTALVVVDHGSRRTAANALAEAVADQARVLFGPELLEVVHAHMELAEPDLGQAVEHCVERGATTVVVGLLFLGRGRHVREDIPRLVGELREQHPSVVFLITDPLDDPAALAALLGSRVRQAADRLREGKASH